MLRKAKEEPLIDERIPHPYREVIKELREIRTQLEEIKRKLAVVPPAPPVVKPPTAPTIVPPAPTVAPAVTAAALSKEDLKEICIEALTKYGVLILPDDLYIQTVDLGIDRSTSAAIQELPKLKGIALTIFRNTGTFDLYINEKDDIHKLPVGLLMTPHLSFKAETYYIGNNPQAGKQVIFIAWKRG